MADWIHLNHHFPSGEPDQKVEKAKAEILQLLGFDASDTFSLTSTAYEAHKHLLFSHYIDFIRETGRTHILTLENEVPTILQTIKRLEKFEVQGKILPVNEQGQLTKKTLEEALRPRSSLLSISLANPYTGVIQPIIDIAKVCKDHDVRLHVDIGSALGKIYLPFGDIEGISFLTFDGGIIARKGEKLEPLPTREFESYSRVLEGLKSCIDKMDQISFVVAPLRDLFEDEVLRQIRGARVLMKESLRLPNVSAIEFEGIHNETLFFHLKRKGLFACKAPGHSTVNFGLSTQTTKTQIEQAVSILSETITKLKPLASHVEYE